MKSKFYSLSGSLLIFFIILFAFSCIYLYAEEKCDCCDVKFSECENTQNAVSTNEYYKADELIDDEQGEENDPSFIKRINPIKGPLYILASPFAGIPYSVIGGVFGNQEEWKMWANIPFFSLGFLTVGIIDTLTIGTFDKESRVLDFFEVF